MPQVAGAVSWSSHFFTGSAPHIVRIEVPTGEKAGSPTNVTFSEPINLGDVPGNALILDGTTPISKCMLRGTECWQGEMWMSELADVQLITSPLPGTLTLVLAGKVMGSGRTVSESRNMTSQVDPQSDGLRLSVAMSELKSAPGVSFWIEHVQPPAARP